MENQIDPFADKSTWGPGPWQDEPDRLEWRDATTGLPCLAVRGPLGQWCGYVAAPPGHPAHGKEMGDRVFDDLDVHGGLTYAESCQGLICHTPAPGEPDDVWWLGFDCGHMGFGDSDYMPKGDISTRHLSLPGGVFSRGTYRTLAYVKDEVTNLAAQLKDLAP